MAQAILYKNKNEIKKKKQGFVGKSRYEISTFIMICNAAGPIKEEYEN